VKHSYVYYVSYFITIGKKCNTGSWHGNLIENNHLEDKGVNGRIILRWIFREWDVRVWLGSMLLRIGTDGGLL